MFDKHELVSLTTWAGGCGSKGWSWRVGSGLREPRDEDGDKG